MIDNLIHSLDVATCNFCAVKEIRQRLEAQGFVSLNPVDSWNLTSGGKYYVEKNGSAIFAFQPGTGLRDGSGFRILAAHSDSPSLKLKPNPEIYNPDGMVFLNVEKYGGGILYTWFDRPLSLSGRIMVKGKDPFTPESMVVDLRRPVATIPHLAIHFNREVNDGKKISVQKDMKPVIGRFSEEEISRYRNAGGVIKCMVAEHAGVKPEDIISSELNLYPVAAPVLTGAHQEFLQSGRIDDLSMVFTGLEAFLNAVKEQPEASHTRVLAIFDNEETGSGTKQGAHSPFLKNLLERVCISLAGDSKDAFFRNVHGGFLISADDAHAYHPNYPEKHDIVNHPYIGGGPVIKINANCKYMTDAHSAAVFASLCEKAGVKCQYFVNHGDVAGGSTLGNILTSQLEISGVDMGCAIWAMHSACETAGVSDHVDTERVFRAFFA